MGLTGARSVNDLMLSHPHCAHDTCFGNTASQTPLLCCLAGCADHPERARLRLLQPGEDGGRPKTRKASNWGKYDLAAFEAAPRTQRKVVLSRCIRAMKAKTSSSRGQSEVDFAETLDGYKDTLLECPGHFEHAVAALLPSTFTEALTLLEHTGKMPFFMKQGVKLRATL